MSAITELNNFRSALFHQSHSDVDISEQIGSWLNHKVVTVISLPANLALVVGSTATCAVSLCTIGVIKIAVKFFTLGSFELPISTGFEPLMKNTEEGIIDLAVNIFELIYDAGNFVYQGYRLSSYVVEKLHLDGIFSVIIKKTAEIIKSCFVKLGRALDFCLGRIVKGFDKASESENCEIKTFNENLPYLVQQINKGADANRINNQDRSVLKIFKHYVWSVPVIICNTPMCAVSTCAFLVLGSAFVAKASIYAVTNINIPIPTYAEKAFFMAAEAGINASFDALTDVADVFVLGYKAVDALGVVKVAATVFDCICYIPKALFK